MPDTLPLSDTVPDDARAAIRKGIIDHNNALLGPTDRQNIFIPLEDDEGKVEGGLIGYTGRGWLYTEMLYVPERLRGRGLAGQLLQRAEDEAKARGCKGAYIDTINPQACRAYQRQGYQICGAIDNFTSNFAITWLKKLF
ncbi:MULTISPECIES: GNAT family N-acetyltransferase [Alphaproteobacteria]|uniref:Acetyltransferase n=2 Tax=Alphaproteobacteria TaxID=28211 RepID=A0A512HEV6_9HYPH|nr:MULTISPECIES: GNAT family N-acetyltransferase [Alphaproteobacteria]GEO83967.1 acetyltransferase [Ciceribacter naphthalenivorans]GLR21155.1 acetyltransferase [Ciceribacter naphthalenivorans]GLT04011.1 acetyltransferase [Sphingomonas psychrolutea]